MQKKNLIVTLATNLGLLLAGFAMTFSGFAIQFSYHMGHHGSIDKSHLALGISYAGWSVIHKTSIVIVSFLAIAHIMPHLKWYKTIIRKMLFRQNRLVIALTILFVIVAVTGYIPWCIDLAGGRYDARRGFIEVHDKLAFILIVYLSIHVVRRMRWFITSYRRLRQSPRRETRPVKTARKEGATDREIAEAIFVAAALTVGGAFAHSTIAMGALKETEGKEAK